MSDFSVSDYTSGHVLGLHKFRQAWPEDRLYAFADGLHVSHHLEREPFRSGMPLFNIGRDHVILTDHRILYGKLVVRGDEIRRGEIIRYGVGGSRVRIWLETIQGKFHYFDTQYSDAWSERNHFALSYREETGRPRLSTANWSSRLLWILLLGLLVMLLVRTLYPTEPEAPAQRTPTELPKGDKPL
jgi:hypothetical protein